MATEKCLFGPRSLRAAVNNWLNPAHDKDRAWLNSEFLVEVQPRYAKGGTTTTGQLIPTKVGRVFGFGHARPEFLGGFNKFSVMYGRGPAGNFTTSVAVPAGFDYTKSDVNNEPAGSGS